MEDEMPSNYDDHGAAESGLRALAQELVEVAVECRRRIIEGYGPNSSLAMMEIDSMGIRVALIHAKAAGLVVEGE